MKAALISLGSVSSKWTLKAMQKYFKKVDDIDLRCVEININTDKLDVLYNGKPIEEYDCVFAKGSFRYEALLKSIAYALYDKTYMPINPEAFTIGHDKLVTHLYLKKHNIPMPKTYLAATTDAAKNILRDANYPVIMKFPQGTGGKGVMFADSFASASSMLDALTALRQPFIIQEYIETEGEDIRAIVVGNKVVAAMKRKAVFGEKRSNIHAGGHGEACSLDSYTKKIAIKSAQAIGAEICAVDIMEGVKGPLVIEVNLSPGLQGITKTTGIDVADKIAKFLYKKSSERKDGEKVNNTKKLYEDLGIDKAEKINEIITNLDFRGERILLPKQATDSSKISEDDEVTICANKGEIIIKKFGPAKE